MTSTSLARAACGIQLLLLFMLAAHAAEINPLPMPWTFHPTRALRVEGGAVSFQAGIRCDPDLKRFNRRTLPYPTEYFLVVTNERDTPIWAAVEFGLPGENPKKYEGEVRPRKLGVFYYKSQGLIVDTPIPIKILLHADPGRTQVLAEKETFIQFPGSSKEAFLDAIYEAARKAKASRRQCPLMSGWQEMRNFDAVVPGTKARGELQHDIKVLLWKEQSKEKWECEHEIVTCEQLPTAESIILSKVSEEIRRLWEQGQQEGALVLERWSIASCGAMAKYEVLLAPSSKGGTDIMVEKIGDKAAEGRTK